MALIVITVQDIDPNQIDVKLTCDPVIKPSQGAEYTLAQTLGAIALNAIHNELSKEESKPRLQIVGADYLPH